MDVILLLGFISIILSSFLAVADDPTNSYTWTVTYGNISLLGFPQQSILINGAFPGPRLDVVTNDNIIINVINLLDEPFLLTWNGIKQRKNSWQDGVLGTNCPIPPNANYTYRMQTKDQIGTFTYFPSTALHRAAGAFGGLNVFNRAVISLPYPTPAGDFTLIVSEWYNSSHKELRQRLDSGISLPSPNTLLINGLESTSSFTGDEGETYRFRFSNLGLETSINFRFEGHVMKLVEMEGSHVIQSEYSSLDLHPGQSMAVLVTLNQKPGAYYIVASTRFRKPVRSAIATLWYTNSNSASLSGKIPPPPAGQYHWSMLQARSIRWNLTANAARPNPQGSYRYGSIPVARTLELGSSEEEIGGKLRYAVNGVSFVVPDTPLKLADAFSISGVFDFDGIPSKPAGAPARFGTPAVRFLLHDFVEVVFENDEDVLQAWHLDGYDFWVVGYGNGKWTNATRSLYNLVDAPTRYTVQVFPKGWTAILVSLDNEGMWNMRSGHWGRQYLGQQLYFRVWSPERSLRNEYNIPDNALLCGKAIGHHT